MDKFSFGEKLKNIKHKEIVLGGIALCIVLVVYFIGVSCMGTQDNAGSASTDFQSSDYCTAMQKNVERAVSQIAGVGSASVVINWDKSVATGAFGGGTENPKATGALVVCDGGDSTKVKLDVMFAVSTLLDLSIEKIIVYPKNPKSQEAI